MVYTVQERVEMVTLYYENQKCARAAARIFNNNHPGRNVQHKYVLQLINKFVATGSVNNKKSNRARIVNNEAVAVAVLGHVSLMENTQSLTKLSDASGVLRTSVFRILHRHKFHPYKIRLVHELYGDDFERRTEFCEILSERVSTNANLLYNICFRTNVHFI